MGHALHVLGDRRTTGRIVVLLAVSPRKNHALANDDPILGALKGWRYTPVMYQGHPQRVLLTIPVRVPRPS